MASKAPIVGFGHPVGKDELDGFREMRADEMGPVRNLLTLGFNYSSGLFKGMFGLFFVIGLIILANGTFVVFNEGIGAAYLQVIAGIVAIDVSFIFAKQLFDQKRILKALDSGSAQMLDCTCTSISTQGKTPESAVFNATIETPRQRCSDSFVIDRESATRWNDDRTYPFQLLKIKYGSSKKSVIYELVSPAKLSGYATTAATKSESEAE